MARIDQTNQDHGALLGLGDNDHPQYLLTSGGTLTGSLFISGTTNDIQLTIRAGSNQSSNILNIINYNNDSQIIVDPSGGMVINETGLSVANFRVESNLSTHALFMNALDDSVLICDAGDAYFTKGLTSSGGIAINTRNDQTMAIGSATQGNSSQFMYQYFGPYAFQTSGLNVATTDTFLMAKNEGLTVVYTLVGVAAGGSGLLAEQISTSFRKQGSANPTIVGSSIIYKHGTLGSTFSLASNGNTMRFAISGTAGSIINWSLGADFMITS